MKTSEICEVSELIQHWKDACRKMTMMKTKHQSSYLQNNRRKPFGLLNLFSADTMPYLICCDSFPTTIDQLSHDGLFSILFLMGHSASTEHLNCKQEKRYNALEWEHAQTFIMPLRDSWILANWLGWQAENDWEALLWMSISRGTLH